MYTCRNRNMNGLTSSGDQQPITDNLKQTNKKTPEDPDEIPDEFYKKQRKDTANLCHFFPR